VVLSDAPIPPDSTEAVDQQAYWGINITHIEQALSHLLGEGQEVSEGGVLTSPSWLGPISRVPSTHCVSSHTLFPVSQGVQSHPVSSLTLCPVTPCFQSHRVSGHTLFPVSQGVRSHPVSSLTGCPVTPCFQSHRVSSHTLFPVSQGVQSAPHTVTGCVPAKCVLLYLCCVC
jgi:hypothetical protein